METVKHTGADGILRQYESNVFSHPYANLDLSRSHKAAGVVDKIKAEQPLNSKKKLNEDNNDCDRENCLDSNIACDQRQTYVDIVGGISEKRPNDNMSLDDTRARIKFAIDIHDPNFTDF